MFRKGITLGLLVGLIFISACSWFSKSKDTEVLEYAPRVVNSIPAPKPPQREPGSLWSDDSRWNDIYSPTQARYPGDVATVKISPALKAKILAASEAALSEEQKESRAKEKEKIMKEGKGAKEEAKSNKGEAVAAGTGGNAQASQNDTKQFEATIMEVMSRGVYKLSANKGLHIGAKDPYVAFTASARERDIMGDEAVSSDSLFNIQLEVIKDEDLTIAPKPQGAK